MKFFLYPAELTQANCELVFLPLFQDQIPLKGEIGFFDWYLDGRISRLLRQGKLKGTFGESGLLHGAGKFQVEKVLVIGLGESWGLAKRAEPVSSLVVDVISKLKVSHFAMAIPGRLLPHQDYENLAAQVIQGLADSGGHRQFPQVIEIYEPDRRFFQYLSTYFSDQVGNWGPDITYETRGATGPSSSGA
ncbi:MAG: hypothetical protein HYY65_01910 [Candidatus Tectomicrobia bacterium]|uniref:Peptidase M17 leucyl aminopeptidase N-terminal domain-containing protein n=1 Tax=Tectimicrobiota bacterium TaxID=2528274 RepID=A0A932GMY4_UNCTE|nr:hypothetical protein [Candidatus Tectomicrobia bacterium]